MRASRSGRGIAPGSRPGGSANWRCRAPDSAGAATGLTASTPCGGWTWSGGFTQAAQNPTAFADSCHRLVEDPRWVDVFDGIDVDWEYPNVCGLTCDSSGPNAFRNVVSALRTRFGSSALVTAAITADGSNGGKIDATDYAGAAPYLNWIMPMTYDYFGAFNKGPFLYCSVNRGPSLRAGGRSM